MDGVEVIRRIRTWSNMPIIVISARSEDSDKIEVLDNGAGDYLTKSSVADCCTKASIFVGEKENGAMKESARSIQRALPGSNIQILPGMYHGEFSINHADDYVNTVKKIIANRSC